MPDPFCVCVSIFCLEKGKGANHPTSSHPQPRCPQEAILWPADWLRDHTAHMAMSMQPGSLVPGTLLASKLPSEPGAHLTPPQHSSCQSTALKSRDGHPTAHGKAREMAPPHPAAAGLNLHTGWREGHSPSTPQTSFFFFFFNRSFLILLAFHP